MSRTFHHGYKQHARHSKHAYPSEWHVNNLALPYWLWMTTPSKWTNIHMTRPQRVETRRLLHKVMRMTREELENPPLFPLAKKPHEYYW